MAKTIIYNEVEYVQLFDENNPESNGCNGCVFIGKNCNNIPKSESCISNKHIWVLKQESNE